MKKLFIIIALFTFVFAGSAASATTLFANNAIELANKGDDDKDKDKKKKKCKKECEKKCEGESEKKACCKKEEASAKKSCEKKCEKKCSGGKA